MKVVLYGAGEQGQATCRNFASIFEPQDYELAGFMDSDPEKVGRVICGKKVLSMDEVKEIEDVLIFLTIASKKGREEVLSLLTREGLSSKVFSLDGPMNRFYTNEVNTQILIALMKAHGIRKVVANPGTTNISFVGSVQRDPFFEMYSAPDERSAAYIACGLAEESGEPVALSCTGATASRNYLPGLTEAYYSKLPVLAITSSQHIGRADQLYPQMLDRSVLPKDVAKISVNLPTVYSAEDRWDCETKVNNALLALKRNGGGPAHINLVTTYSKYFTRRTLPTVRHMERFCRGEVLPELNVGKVGIFVGAHKRWSVELITAVERFCEKYNAVVVSDHTGNYKGRYHVLPSLVCYQEGYYSPCRKLDVMIHIGEVTGSYVTLAPKEVWRVSPDGEIKDTYKKLKYVFEMEEQAFFDAYADRASDVSKENTFVEEWQQECARVAERIPQLPFSNIWIAQQTSSRLPENSILHLGILNSLRSWNFFDIPKTVYGHSNTGGFGIDGCVSTAIGASLANPDRLVFGMVGDLAFFYDMNSLGNYHIGSNLRLLLISNGGGAEFHLYNHPGSILKVDEEPYVAADGHYGNTSPDLVCHYAQDLGFEYMRATNKEEYLNNLERFVTPKKLDKPIVFEVFTEYQNESDALYQLLNLMN